MITGERGDRLIIDDPVKVWVENELEPRWFGFWHRHVWYVCTHYMRRKFYDHEEAVEFAEVMHSVML